MTREAGSVPVTGFLSPTDIEDNYPTHKDIYGYGGYRSVATLADRDAIDVTARSIGMQVYVVADSSVYSLQDIESNDWVKMVGIVNGVPDYNIDDTDLGTLTLNHNYIYQGDLNNKPVPSSSLIDMTIDQIDMQNQIAQTYAAHVMLTAPSVAFPNGTVVSSTAGSTKRNYMFVQEGVVSTSERISFSALPILLEDHVTVGTSGLLGATQKRYELNSIPNNGDIDFKTFKGINAGEATTDTDLVTLGQVNNLIVDNTNIQLTGAVSGNGLLTDPIVTYYNGASFAIELGVHSISRMNAPDSNFGFAGKQLLDLGAGTTGTSAVNLNQLNAVAKPYYASLTVKVELAGIQNTSLSSAGVFYLVNYNVDTNSTSGFTISSGGRITFTQPGASNVNFKISGLVSYRVSASSVSISFVVRKNGADVNSLVIARQLTPPNSVYCVPIAGIITLSENDYIELYASSSAGSTMLGMYDLNINVEQL